MTNKLENLFEESVCPDRRTLFSYVAGTLNPAREHLVERHLTDCDFCSEAVEAYRQEKDLPMINEQLIELEEKIIRGQTGRRAGGFFNAGNYLKYAAVLALVLLSMTGLYFLLSDRTNQDLVMEAPVSRQAPSVQKEDRRNPSSPEPAKAVKMNSGKGAAKNSAAENEIGYSDGSHSESLDLDEPSSTLSASTSTESLKDKNAKVKTELAAVNKKKPKPVKDENLVSTAKEESQMGDDSYRLATQGDTDTKSLEGRETSVTSLENTPSDAVAKKNKSLLDSAVNEYEKGYYINTINILLAFSSKERKESAKAEWYLASAYVQTREYEKAKPLLEKLKNEGASYSRKARKLLEKIQ
ncbi:MAG: hypothetical protein EYC69_14710 [Bacteroidetes bacterium]|nr:MAG: hypothetical protein EYC69_14710 [Bacteroidota bacterium]